MSTISDTLVEIPKVQDALDKMMVVGTLDDEFLKQLFNLIGIYYFDLLSHACMNSLNTEIKNGSFSGGFVKYNQISEQDGAYEELIKIGAIGNLFVVWAKFEQFVYRHIPATGKVAGDFQKAHRVFMEKQKIRRKRVKEIEVCFTGIRRTRNSLHNDGIYYNEDGKSYDFDLLGEKYSLEHNKPVKPIRTMSLVNYLIEHYNELNGN